MTFKILIIEDNHSFIDSLKVMLRDLPLEFAHAFRYTDAQAIIEKTGVFYNKQVNSLNDANGAVDEENPPKRHHKVQLLKLFNEGGIFLIIVEQNTETNMKGVDFIGHAIRKFPNLSETDFILLTHRLELVPPRNYVYPVLEKPLRAAQIRQVVMQRMKYAQDIVAMQARAETETTVTLEERPVDGDAPKKKGIRDLLKINRKTENNDGETEKAASTSTNKKALKSAKASTKTTKELAPKKSVSKTKTSKLKKKS